MLALVNFVLHNILDTATPFRIWKSVAVSNSLLTVSLYPITLIIKVIIRKVNWEITNVSLKEIRSLLCHFNRCHYNH